MHNVQRRIVNAPAERVGALLDRSTGPDDPLWPSHAWPPLLLDRPLGVGADGGHGPIRYTVAEYEPGRRLRFRFDPAIGLDGYHELRVEPAGPERCVLVHDMVGRATGGMVAGWPLGVRWLHEALVQDLLDNAERAATGELRRPARWSPWVRLLRRFLMPRPRRVPLPAGAGLAHGVQNQVDLVDAWQGVRLPGTSTEPTLWQRSIFARPPAWMAALVRLRHQQPKEMFVPFAATADEVLIGFDGRHFDVRVSVHVGEKSVVCSTLARPRTRRGRAYLAVVLRIHPLVMRGMLGRAVRSAPRPAEPVEHRRYATSA